MTALFDHLGTTGQIPSERQTMLDLLVSKDMLEQGAFEQFWVPTSKQYGDVLTKRMKRALWGKFCSTGLLSLKESQEDRDYEEHRKGLRRGQRERWKDRFAQNTGRARAKKKATKKVATDVSGKA